MDIRKGSGGYNSLNYKSHGLRPELDQSKFIITENFEKNIVNKINDLVSETNKKKFRVWAYV